MDAFRQAWSPRLLSVLRIMTALMLLQHGTAKYLGFPHVEAFDNLQPLSLLGASGVIELVGGVLILIGLVISFTAACVAAVFRALRWFRDLAV